MTPPNKTRSVVVLLLECMYVVNATEVSNKTNIEADMILVVRGYGGKVVKC